ncbi:TatD family hydrolase [Lysinibacter cavernae]|uniref:TatD DNase family protein n=1 Tax=Lysinibacter cavernae TaxID=1640652 RepID=A0A7X5QY68_9MICO|nr:TatD family hydrolase [Lysinibacter cavernae]NIH52169.1 TatD DNase family protein [Lysinibacter cavernae]
MSEAKPIRAREKTEGRDLTYPPLPEPLEVPVYDNHTHLEIEDGESGLDAYEQLDLAERVGVRGVVQVGTDLATSRWSAALAAKDPRVLAAVALHPNEAPRLAERGLLDEHLAGIDELGSQPRVRAVGETGLDFFRTGEDGRASQLESFEAHIEIAKRHGIALQIHDRDAHEAVVDTLLRVGAPERTVFHCYSGDEQLASICAEHGWFMSFAGTVTFKSATNLRSSLRVAPRSLIMVETDAPFLTPMPYRGRPNSAYLIPNTLRYMAMVLDADLNTLSEQIAYNTEQVYGSWDSK